MNRKPLSDGARLALEEVQRLAVRYAASADGSEPYTLHFTVYGTDNKGLLQIEPRCCSAYTATAATGSTPTICSAAPARHCLPICATRMSQRNARHDPPSLRPRGRGLSGRLCHAAHCHT